MKKNQTKRMALLVFSVVAAIGTYNAVMINSDSIITSHESKNFKRLDEIYGVVTQGRSPAVTTHWSKIGNQTAKVIKKVEPAKVQSPSIAHTVPAEELVEETPPAFQDVHDLKLVEVNNPTIWQQGVKAELFSGSISTRDGIIESLTATLPEGKTIDISFSELSGNTFEYDMDGEVYQAMMYQVDQNAFMVNLTSGPLKGTRMRFAGEPVSIEEQREATNAYLAETHHVEIGNFGQEMDRTLEATPLENPEMHTAENSSPNFSEQI